MGNSCNFLKTIFLIFVDYSKVSSTVCLILCGVIFAGYFSFLHCSFSWPFSQLLLHHFFFPPNFSLFAGISDHRVIVTLLHMWTMDVCPYLIYFLVFDTCMCKGWRSCVRPTEGGLPGWISVETAPVSNRCIYHSPTSVCHFLAWMYLKLSSHAFSKLHANIFFLRPLHI